MPELKIKVGASVDRNLSIAYQPLIEAANKAAAAITAAGTRGRRAVAASAKAGADEAVKSHDKVAASAERTAQAEQRASKRTMASKMADVVLYRQLYGREDAALLRDVDRREREKTAATDRESRNRARIRERELRQRQHELNSLRHRAGSAAYRTGARVIGAGIGVGRSVAGAMGVDLDIGSLIQKGVSLETAATDLSNAAFMPSKAGANGQRQDPRAIINEVRNIAIQTGNDSGSTMAGLQAFVGKTGDLETARAVLFDLSKLAKSTGTNMEDMVDAAGDVSNALGDIPNKGAAVKSVMAAIAAQGKEGAVEIKDLATQMAKLGAAAGSFTGDTKDVMAQMGALVQMTRAKGGAASSTQAATSVLSFTNTFSKAARRNAFKAAGVQIEDANGKLRNPRDIIIDALRATKGNTESMGKLIADSGARRVTRGFEDIYKDAGGGDSGLQKVREAFDALARASVNAKEMEDSFAAAMKTSESQAKIFNEQLGKIAVETQRNLLPALQALAPAFLSLTKNVASFVGNVTGATEKKERSDDVSTEFKALNAATQLDRDLSSGTFAAGDTERAGLAKSALSSALERKRKQVAEEGQDVIVVDTATKGHVTKKLADMSDDEIQKTMTESSGETEDKLKRYVADREQVARMSDTLSRLDQNLQTAMTRALESSIVNVRLSDPLYTPTPSLVSPSAGVEPPPGHPSRHP